MPVLEEFNLSGRVALLAGDGDCATPYLALALAEAGARVVIADRQSWVLNEAGAMAGSLGPGPVGYVCNPSDQGSVEALVEEVWDTCKLIDVLVNVFRTPQAKPITQTGESDYREVMDRNFKPVYLFCRLVGEKMLSQGGGKIINISNNMAERGLAEASVYCASQGAILQLSRALALEWGRNNIRVNVIGTGWSSTEEIDPEEAQKELLVRYIPLRRKGHPRDIGPLLVYLASDSCDYTTGQPIYVDGGLMAHP